MTQPLGEFSAAFGDSSFLLVKLDDPTGELEAGLAALKSSAQNKTQPNLNVLAFHTVVADVNDVPRAFSNTKEDPTGVSVAELRRRLAQARHFAITLDKRVNDGTYTDRISVGRARNKDIVLRHPSVSKFHAWFERDPQGVWCVADAGSKNGTRANAVEMQPRDLVKVKQGDLLRFGSVEAMVCSADSLWRTVRST
ncbi:MAG TPA: FHA domain-containing protein [Polyangiales bacterium]|nr:FHA domain-containing protein [Polyangiales bacterium]